MWKDEYLEIYDKDIKREKVELLKEDIEMHEDYQNEFIYNGKKLKGDDRINKIKHLKLEDNDNINKYWNYYPVGYYDLCGMDNTIYVYINKNEDYKFGKLFVLVTTPECSTIYYEHRIYESKFPLTGGNKYDFLRRKIDGMIDYKY